MDSLISQIANETGVSKETASKIVDIVLRRVKSQLPTRMQGLLDKVVDKDGTRSAGLTGIASGMIGNFFATK